MRLVISFTPEDFLNEISPNAPCGKNLEDDLAFTELENAAKFIDERQMGDAIVPAVEPDWKKVRDLAIALLGRSRDIQVSMHLTCALVHTDGFIGLEQGLSLIRGLLETYWDDVYPRQDPDDDYPILRINTLSTLKDYKKILSPVSQIKLSQSKVGNFSWRDIEIAQGKISAAANSGDLPDIALIEAAFLDTPIESLKQQETNVKKSLQHAQGIVTLVAEKAGSSNVPDISPLISLLKNIGRLLAEKIQQRPESEQKESEGSSVLMQDNTASDGAAEKRRGSSSKSGDIHSREDVVRSIDAICKYFERYEPSSPIPFLLLRAKKLLAMDFMEILRDLAPDAVSQAENICGVNKKDKN